MLFYLPFIIAAGMWTVTTETLRPAAVKSPKRKR
jgi:hypothetical protein